MSNVNKAISYMDSLSQCDKPVLDKKIVDDFIWQQSEEKFYDENSPRIMLFGQFKAGKSSFINAITGRDIAAVDVLEKTAWIARYWNADHDFCRLIMKDDTTSEMDLASFLQSTENDSLPESFLAQIKRIDVGYTGGKLPYTFIDTPGIGSVNNQNEELALDAIKDADLVIYTVDINKLGNKRESDIIARIRASKVPMICLAAKYDGDVSKHKDYEEAREMVSRNTDFSVDEIYPFSARNYSKGLAGVEDGSKRLLEFLDSIQVRNHEYRRDARLAKDYRIKQSLSYQLRNAEASFINMQQGLGSFEREYQYKSKRVHTELDNYIRDYIKSSLYGDYRPKIIRMLELATKAEATDMGAVLSDVLPADYMDNYWQTLSEKIEAKTEELWTENEDLPSPELETLKDFLQLDLKGQRQEFAFLNNVLEFGHSSRMTKKGVKISLGAAGFASFYQAVLGANAATIALPAAMSSVGVPIALMGLALTYYVKKETSKDIKKNIDIKELLDGSIAEFAGQISEQVLAKMKEVDEVIKVNNLDIMKKEIAKSLPGDSIEEAIDKLNQMSDEMDADLKELSITLDPDIRRQREKESFDRELEKYQNQIRLLNNNLQKANAKLAEEQDKKSSLEARIARKDAEFESTQKKLERASKNAEAKSEETAKLKDKLEKIKQEKKQLKDKAKETDKILKEQDERIKSLNSQKDSKDEQYETIIQEYKRSFEQRQTEDQYRKHFDRIRDDLNEFVLDKGNRWKLPAPVAKENQMTYENLMLLSEDSYQSFLTYFKEFLQKGNANLKANSGEKLRCLSNNNYIIGSREKGFRIYFAYKPNSALVDIQYIDTFHGDGNYNQELTEDFRSGVHIVDDQLRHKIIDEISTAEHEILMMVPWITESAWTKVFSIDGKPAYDSSIKDAIKAAIKKHPDLKVRIITGYKSKNGGSSSRNYRGNGSSNDGDKERETNRVLAEIKRDKEIADNIKVYNDRNTHVKAFTVDNRCSLYGSYNYLSNQGVYSGDKNRDHASESMEIQENPIQVEVTRREVYMKANIAYKKLPPS